MGAYAMMAGVRMEHRLICETFDRQTLHPCLKWFNPPPSWRVDAVRSRLLVEPGAETDFWQRTHYGFRADSGHFLYAEVAGDGALSATVLAVPVHQYDQAGLMVRSSETCWLKASVEYELDTPSRLGTVVTNNGFSDWSLQDFPGAGTLLYCLRIHWEGDDFFVEHAPTESGPWHLMRVAHLFRKPSVPLLCGIYACSPKGPGFRAEFSSLRIQQEGRAPDLP
jgi:uncharacterized protein